MPPIDPIRPGTTGSSTLKGANDSANLDQMLDRAGAALNNRRPHDAERLAGEVLRAEPRHWRALHVFGLALVAQGRGAEAIAPLESVVRGRSDAEVETALAIALRQAGRLDDALSRLKRTAKRHPHFAPVFRELGSVLFALERCPEAIAALRSGLDLAPMMPELSIQLGLVFLHQRDCRNAKAAFERALMIVPNSAEALFGIGKAHQEVGENDAAAGYFRRYLMLRPNDANAWLTLGHCLLELSRRDAGFDCLRTVVRDHPGRYDEVLGTLVTSGHGRFWLRPSAAARFLSRKNS
jgi:tetratricopeptide (TPR) repeat protein